MWVGKDVKIGKNTRICSGSIVGWGSLVTKAFDTPNVLLAGVPAKVRKENYIKFCCRLLSESCRSFPLFCPDSAGIPYIFGYMYEVYKCQIKKIAKSS